MAGIQETPDSEACSFECFQNYTAPEVFVQGLAGIVDQQDVEAMIRAQKQMLQRFEKTNEMLLNCNHLSINRHKMACNEFKKHISLLVDIKKDLDYVFKKIRLLKGKLSQTFPKEFEEAVRSSLAEEAIDFDVTNKEGKQLPFEDASAERKFSAKLQMQHHNDSSSTDTDTEQTKPDSSFSSDTC